MSEFDERFRLAVNQAIQILGRGSKNKLCGTLGITTSHFYQMVARGRFSANLSLQIEHDSKGIIKALDLCPVEDHENNGDIENDNTDR